MSRRLAGTVAFRVLGPVEAMVDGQPIDLGPRKRRLVFAVLLLECGRPVPVDKLVDLTWDEPPPAARRVVFAHIARLRKALAGAGVALVTEPSGYALRVEPSTVDVHLFRQLVDTARTALDPPARAALLRDALDLWRGPPLEGLRSRVFIAGVLPNTADNLINWIVQPRRWSPRSAMPETGIDADGARDIAAYLYGH